MCLFPTFYDKINFTYIYIAVRTIQEPLRVSKGFPAYTILSFVVRAAAKFQQNGGRSSPPTLIICDRSQKEVQVAHGFYGIINTFSVDIDEMTYQTHSVPKPKSPIPTSSLMAGLLIYYALAGELSTARSAQHTGGAWSPSSSWSKD